MRDDTPNIIAAAAVTLPLATAALLLRLLSRRITKTGYGWDDVFAIVGWIGSLALLINGMIWIRNGLGRPMDYNLSKDYTYADKQRTAWLQIWCTSMTYTFAIAFSKFAIVTFYWRLFQYSDIRVPIQVLSAVTVSWFFLRLFMVTLQCIPTSAFWEEPLETKSQKCHVRESAFFFSTVLTHVLIDCAILALPAIEVGRLHLPKGQKVAVIALFAFGAVTCLASIFVLIESFRYKSDSPEPTLQFGPHYAWSIAECNLALPYRCSDRSPEKSSQDHSSAPTAAAANQQKVSAPFSNGIKLTGITKTKERDGDGSSSTHELTPGIEPGPSDFEAPDWPHSAQTVISSPWRKYTSSRDFQDLEQGGGGGIHVYNETAVNVERI
ncbi:hypothetical protein CEP52_002472 [Fusarium oligoseptatum]|uniref:Rhodopsin domain-containing protein n=1 Tax=Fusarium oligoseptatum TaxID=2604345 RepID=A0A428UDQ2_9HYPO|nr:hypothetical protein CEP52_002472 [Fusarium oligoseptatum]